jgi:hypothetical protein
MTEQLPATIQRAWQNSGRLGGHRELIASTTFVPPFWTADSSQRCMSLCPPNRPEFCRSRHKGKSINSTP